LLLAVPFYLGTASGLILVPPTFHIPCIGTNWSPIAGRPHGPHDLYMPKLYRSRPSGRTLSFSESWQPPLAECYNINVLAAHGIELIDNTAEEILGSAVEMIQRLDGTMIYSDEDERLHKRYDELFLGHASRYGNHGVNCRVVREFLRHHRELLESPGLTARID